MASLLLLTGARKGQRLPLEDGRTVLGRDAGCHVVINSTMVRSHPATLKSDSVSRRHAIISCVGGKFYIEDGDGEGRKSRNHTFVNNREVTFGQRLLLRNNDQISICDFACTFLDDEDPVAVEATLDHSSSVQSLRLQPAEKLRLILEISNSLSTTLDLDALLPRMVESLLRLFQQADRCLIILREEPSGALVVRAFQSRPPGAEANPRFSASIIRRCMEKVQAILGNDPLEMFPESESIPSLPMRSMLCAPLWAENDRPLGAIQLDTCRPKSRFTEEDLSLLLGVASQASIALCNVHLHEKALLHQRRERALADAQHVQRALLPQRLPDVPGYAFHAVYESAEELGGDYYDFLPLPGGRLAILLGDVAGKGVPAALVMVKFSVEARVCLEAEPDLPAAVSKLNSRIAQAAVSERFVTLIAGVLDPATHSVTLVNAGHPSPLLYRHATGTVEAATSAEVSGPPIGIDAGSSYAGCTVSLQPGDKLLLFSDGISEAMDAEDHQFKTQRIYDILNSCRGSPHETAHHVLQAVKQHASGCKQNDDITLVCLGRDPGT
jgi:serine phosphatase RsbU (regulator of sigma subunit)